MASGLPNLDRMEDTALMAFSERHRDGKNYKLLFDSIFPGILSVVSDAANYAAAKLGERAMREDWDPPQELVYTWLCDIYYQRIPVTLRWRRVP